MIIACAICATQEIITDAWRGVALELIEGWQIDMQAGVIICPLHQTDIEENENTL